MVKKRFCHNNGCRVRRGVPPSLLVLHTKIATTQGACAEAQLASHRVPVLLASPCCKSSPNDRRGTVCLVNSVDIYTIPPSPSTPFLGAIPRGPRRRERFILPLPPPPRFPPRRQGGEEERRRPKGRGRRKGTGMKNQARGRPCFGRWSHRIGRFIFPLFIFGREEEQGKGKGKALRVRVRITGFSRLSLFP